MGPTEPLNVAMILGDGVRVRALPHAIRSDLVEAGRSVATTRWGAVVSYEPGASHLDNPDLIGLLQLLASVGVGFARDHKQPWSPADVVAELIGRGTESCDPWACDFDGHIWHVRPYPWFAG